MQSCYWCMFASSYSFIVAYLIDSGIDVSTAGFAMAASTLTGFFGQFVISAICDRLQRSKTVYIAGMIYLVIVLYIIITGEKTETFVIVMLGLFGFVHMPMSSVLDAWIMKSFNDTTSYAPIRSWGSITYAVFVVAFGAILDQFGYDASLYFSMFFVIINTIVAATLPEAAPTHRSVKAGNINKGSLLNKKFLFFLFLMFLYGFSVQPLFQMLSVIVLDVGGTPTAQGICLFFAGVVQMPILLITPKFSKISPQKRLVAAMLCFIVCLCVLSFATTIVHVIIGMTLNGIGYAINISALRETSISMCSKHLKTTAVAIADAFYISLAGCVSTAVSGVVMETYSTQSFMIIANIILIISTFCFAVFYSRKT